MRLTEFASPQHCCCALFWIFTQWNVQGTFSWVFYIPVNASCAYIYLSCPEEERSITEKLLWYKLVRFYGLPSPLRIYIPFKIIFLWPIDHHSAGYLTECIASYTGTLLQVVDTIHPRHAPVWTLAWGQLFRTMKVWAERVCGPKPTGSCCSRTPRNEDVVYFRDQPACVTGTANTDTASAITPPAGVPQAPTTGAGAGSSFVANHGTCRVNRFMLRYI